MKNKKMTMTTTSRTTTVMSTIVKMMMVIMMTMTMTMVSSFMISDMLPRSMTGYYRSIAEIQELSHVLIGQTLEIRLDIYDPRDPPKEAPRSMSSSNYYSTPEIPSIGMSLSGLSLVLLSSSLSNKDGNVMKMPGYHGPHPSVSSGIREVSILQTGQYVDMTGIVRLSMEDHPSACWEVIYRESAMSGSLICALPISHAVSRSNNPDCTIPAGPLYISFPIWKRATLTDYQQRKQDMVDRTQELLGIRDEELSKMSSTTNLFMKAFHYRNAAAAVERYTLYPVQAYTSRIPDDIDTIPICVANTAKDDHDDDLVMAKYGTVWTTTKMATMKSTITPQTLLDAAFMVPPKKQNMLGTATLRHIVAVNRHDAMETTTTTTPPTVPTANDHDNDEDDHLTTITSSSSLAP